MKWLFAILVALNIIVFGSMIAGKLVHSNSGAPAAASAASPETEAVAPASPDISVRQATETETVAGSNTTAAKAASKTETTAAPKTTTAATTNASDNTDKQPAAPANTCTATVTLPEDDFHRIKGLLTHWPFTTSRFIEQVSAPAKTRQTAAPTRYMVALSSGNDSSIRARLQEQGFDYGVNQGKVSLGVFNRREDAEGLMARAKMQGFSDAFITTLGGSSDSDSQSSGSSATSIAKMRVVFSGVDNSAMQDINAITGRYGRMQRSGKCY